MSYFEFVENLNDRQYDLVLFGATGYVGGLTAAYVIGQLPAGVRCALAGRDRSKLEAVARRCGADTADVLIADVGDQESLDRMVSQTRVVVSTVGPYSEYGLPLVQACVEAGTDYADLTGEPLFVRHSIDSYHKEAQDTGARIVHSCGFDSVPSDISVHLLHGQAIADDAGELRDTTLVVRKIRGGLSGGTAASGLAHGQEMARDPHARALAADPYTHSHRRAEEPDLGKQTDGRLVRGREIHPRLSGWTGGFFMGPHNTRVVRRSNTLRNWAYGRQFRYSEVMTFPVGPLSIVPAVLTAAVLSSTYRFAPLLRFVPPRLIELTAPKRGTGPSARAREKGHFTCETYTTTSKGDRYCATFSMRGDPGYAATAVILGQVGLTLAIDRARLSGGGVLTPATAMGDALADRLRTAGVTLGVAAV